MYEQRSSEHPFVRLVWRAGGQTDGEFTDAANECWGLAFTRHRDGRVGAELIGPTASARRLDWRAGESYWGVDLESHVFWRGLDKPALLGVLQPLPVESGYVTLVGTRYLVPDHDGVEALVEALREQGVLVGDPLVARALEGEQPALSERALQRRFRQTTGLARKRIEQVRRAREAYRMLQQGMAPAEVAAATGYADQAHLSRSLRVFAGQTPRQILLGG
ncbi:helix-turn-helix domain-containing protein [Desertihabitans aurantiacus]|uniref:helix-turn-helix domain-containing protein n=1 Tax=Desertihabitans aurantiacus TaxID=2282477 RepID=UPI000DF858E7|nr:AraC family transcriptional regulator [Desertihabitans aurantiacus]